MNAISTSRLTATSATVASLPSPFGYLTPTLSVTDLRDTTYEIFVAACRTSTGKSLTYISTNSSASDRSPSSSSSLSNSPSMQRSITSTAASKMKKALGLRSSSNLGSGSKKSETSPSSGGKAKKPLTVGELMRVQMKISEATDSRVRRALLRIAAGQLSTMSSGDVMSSGSTMITPPYLATSRSRASESSPRVIENPLLLSCQMSTLRDIAPQRILYSKILRILEANFEEEMKQIIKILPKARQTVLFSATQTKKVEDLARLSFQTTPIYIDVDDGRTREYIHRVGRTARGEGAKGSALLFLILEELQFLSYLKAAKVHVKEYEFNEKKLANVQSALEKLISTNYDLNKSAKDAYRSYILAYNSHSMKDIFNVHRLDLQAVAASFCFSSPPKVNLNIDSSATKFKNKPRKIEGRSRHGFSENNPYGRKATHDNL